ncbi:MAG: biopolymer transporter ExbD [Planctomycetaceae bacterium]|nr:biopolymer transporter ExbD [Planctomycetaceae bacterium]
MFDDDSGFKKKKKVAEGELDITPMIDVTFLLLIFFMVTSTMQATPDRDIPPALSGLSENPSAMLELVISPPLTAGGEPEIMLEGRKMNIEELKVAIAQEASVKEAEIMVMAEREVPNGMIGDVESALAEIENVTYHFAVQDRK